MSAFYDIFNRHGQWIAVRRYINDAIDHAELEQLGNGAWIVRRRDRHADRAQWARVQGTWRPASAVAVKKE